ncbi:MAG: Beta-lactamase class C-like and penicillin binding proteins (PBPs) superfamily, partial [uncultured Gemmatimonadaceae bacterium]
APTRRHALHPHDRNPAHRQRAAVRDPGRRADRLRPTRGDRRGGEEWARRGRVSGRGRGGGAPRRRGARARLRPRVVGAGRRPRAHRHHALRPRLAHQGRGHHGRGDGALRRRPPRPRCAGAALRARVHRRRARPRDGAAATQPPLGAPRGARHLALGAHAGRGAAPRAAHAARRPARRPLRVLRPRRRRPRLRGRGGRAAAARPLRARARVRAARHAPHRLPPHAGAAPARRPHGARPPAWAPDPRRGARRERLRDGRGGRPRRAVQHRVRPVDLRADAAQRRHLQRAPRLQRQRRAAVHADHHRVARARLGDVRRERELRPAPRAHRVRPHGLHRDVVLDRPVAPDVRHRALQLGARRRGAPPDAVGARGRARRR